MQLHTIIMVRNPVENRKTFSSELLFSLMPLLLRLRRGKLASGQWPVRIPKFTQPRHVIRVGVEIHYLTLTSSFKSFSPILFMQDICLFQCQTRILCIHIHCVQELYADQYFGNVTCSFKLRLMKFRSS